MDPLLILKFLVLAVGFYMAWNIGAQDVSNAMGTSVGSGALTLRRAVIIAAILEFSGAYFLGSNVSETLQRGIINVDSLSPMLLIIGMCAALLGTSVWLQIASFFGWPVSTTHAIVGAIIGFGGIVGGMHIIHWGEVGSIALSWILSPAISGVIAFIIFGYLQRRVLFAMNPIEATKKLIPIFVFIVIGTFALSLLSGGIERIYISFVQALGIAALAGLIAAFITHHIVKRLHFPQEEVFAEASYSPQNVASLGKALKHLQRVHIDTYDTLHDRIAPILDEVRSLSRDVKKETSISKGTTAYQPVEKMFAYLQILSACFVAFAHGANDVANAIGPLAAVLDIINNGTISISSVIPTWLLVFGGVGIVIGLATWGWRVMATIGKKITELTPTRGFCAEFGAAATILLASKLGMPVSTTHCLVGAVLGVGLARGLSAINLRTIKDIVLSWLITLPAAALVSIIFFYILKLLFL